MFEMNEATWTLIRTHAVRVVGVLVLLFVAWIVAGWTKRLVARSLTRHNFDPTLTKFFSGFAKSLVLLLTVIACLGAFGIETTSFAAVLGAAGLAIGLAFQGSLSNLAAGVMLLVFRPFKVGDVVSVCGHTGKIDEIELFTTRMTTPDNRLVIHPNSTVFGATIENVTFNDTRRVDVDVGVDYSADVDRTREILLKAAGALSDTLPEPAAQVVLAGLGASSVDWQVRVWVKTPDFFGVKEALTRAVKVELDQAKIGIPFPQLDIHLDSNLAQTLPRSVSQAV